MNSSPLIQTIAELYFKSAAVVLAALLLQCALRRRSSAYRQLVWSAAFVILAVLPFASLIPTHWQMPGMGGHATALVRMPWPSVPPSAGPMTELAQASGSARSESLELPAHAVPVLWGAGCSILLSLAAWGAWRLRGFRRASVPIVDPKVLQLAQQMFAGHGIRREVLLRTATDVPVPLTWGVLRPVLLLPADFLKGTDGRLMAALRHESAHIRRHDYLLRLTSQFACAIYWANPLVWFAARQLRLEQEHAADDFVVSSGVRVDEYVEQLLECARALSRPQMPMTAAAGMAAPGTLEKRMLAIVDEKRDRRQPGARVLWLSAASVLAISLSVGMGSLFAVEKSETAQGEQIDAEKPTIQIEARLMQAAADKLNLAKAKPMNASDPKRTLRSLSAADYVELLGQTRGAKGVDTVSPPSITTHSGQRGWLEVGAEREYPVEWKKEGADWRVVKENKRFVGFRLEIKAEQQANESFLLDVVALLAELKGYADVDAPDAPLVPELLSNRGAPHAPWPGKRMQPRFATCKITTSVALPKGEVLVLRLENLADPVKGDAEVAKETLVFIQPTQVQAQAGNAAAVDKTPPTESIPKE